MNDEPPLAGVAFVPGDLPVEQPSGVRGMVQDTLLHVLTSPPGTLPTSAQQQFRQLSEGIADED